MVAPWKVLVPFDGSKKSEGAFEKAIELAKLISKGRTRVEVTLFYVVQELVTPYRLFDHDLTIESKITGERLSAKEYMKEVYQGMKSEAKTMLDKKKSQAINDSHIVVKTHVTYGYPSDKIVQFAERHNMNLISIGSVGMTGISKIKTLALAAYQERSLKEQIDL